MEDKKEKELTLREQLEKDITTFSQNIVNATNQINQWLGARLQCQEIIKKLDKDK